MTNIIGYREESFSKNGLQPCDLIMKGGVTSGVVYPLAICELAQKYRFRNIGGTSAGAIAAAVCAAAEYGRLSGRGGKSFVDLSELPNELAVKLPSLFQPTPQTRPLFSIALAVLGEKSGFQRGMEILGAAIAGHWVACVVGAVPGCILVSTSLIFRDPVAVVFGTALMLVGALLAATARMVGVAWVRTLKDNDFGLCSGMHESAGAKDALTPWLGDLIDRLAGTKAPLTFGQLWGAGNSVESDARAINLEMMTSNITSGKPHRLPQLDGTFYFSKTEWSRLFPPRVIDAIAKDERRSKDNDDLFAFPSPSDLPLVVAVRMSLSFPGLLSAVPLYGVDHVGESTAALVRCWFSDGGLISNFPIHLFDHVWPRWPTFAFDICSHPEGKVWLPAIQDDASLSAAPVDSLPAFAGALVDAMQNWSDKTLSLLPGYRERIAHIGLRDSEGGLNLAMAPDVIRSLALRGRDAARLFNGFDWNQHRWTRFLSSMREFREVLESMHATYYESEGTSASLATFLKTYPTDEAFFPAPSAQWLQNACSAAESLVKLLETWNACNAVLEGDGPEPIPQPQLRVSPRY